MNRQKILVVAPGSDSHQWLLRTLQEENYIIALRSDLSQAYSAVLAEKPDLIIVSPLAPPADSFEFCRELRYHTSAPVIYFGGSASEVDEIVALRVGCDDYLAEPISIELLKARIRAAFRRSKVYSNRQSAKCVRRFGDLAIDPGMHEVRKKGAVIPLSSREFQLLLLLSESPGQVYHRDQLYELVWETEGLSDSRTVAVHIRNIRKKIESDPGRPAYIITIRGVGYKFKSPAK